MARPLKSAAARWDDLNAAAVAAYDRDAYLEGTIPAKQALALARSGFGKRHPKTLTSLTNLAFLYLSQGRYGEAEPLFTEALRAGRKVWGSRHPENFDNLNNLAFLYQKQGRYSEAEPLYKEALQARREVLGQRHPDTLTSLNNLAHTYTRNKATTLTQSLCTKRRCRRGARCWASATPTR